MGNIDTITDSHGAVLQRIAYSPFGTRRVTASNDPDYQAWTDRGFTGHEHLDGLGLIHMNARLYDPEIGRFLSPDTYIQAPHNSQNYNRYSYVLNNPLKYTDPSGHFFSSLLNLIEKIGSFLVSYAPTIAGIAVAAFLGPGATFLQAVMHGAAAGFVGGLVGSGSLRGALEGAFWGGITAGSARGIGHGFGANTLLADGSSVAPASPFGAGKWLVHGIAQGAISELRGGNFQSGFVGAVAGSVAGGASDSVMGSLGVASNVGSRTAVAGIFGGLAAKASGGSFADGAVSAAFTHLFNAEAANLRKLYDDRSIKGHHYFPFEEWPDGMPEDVKRIFGGWKSGALSVHVRDRAHIAYGNAVRELFDSMFADPANVTVNDALNFMSSVNQSSDPRISNYLTFINDLRISPSIAASSTRIRGAGYIGFVFGIVPFALENDYTLNNYAVDSMCGVVFGCGDLQ